MKEKARLDRNTERLTEMDPPMGRALRRVLDRMEAQAFRPRIQAAWRSEKDQLIAFKEGESALKFGFHNVTGADGTKQSLAADVLDDDHPLAPGLRYLLALAVAAQAEELHTLILWKLSSKQATKVKAAIKAKDIDAPVTVGFDPTHVEPVGITVTQAKAGKRPTFTADDPPAATKSAATKSAATKSAARTDKKKAAKKVAQIL